jgi:hypothetical protein
MADGDGTVACYVGDPAALGAPVDWPGEESFPDNVARFCADNPVVVRVESG